MKLSKLISAIGDENIKVQHLGDALRFRDNKAHGDTEITFATRVASTADMIAPDPKVYGMIIWIPADKMKQAIKSEKESEVSDA